MGGEKNPQSVSGIALHLFGRIFLSNTQKTLGVQHLPFFV